MSVLSVQAVAKRFADRLVFGEVSFRIARGDRVGLVGPNGCGKTTLLRIGAGLDEPDAGNVAIARGSRIGFLEQELLTAAPGTVEEHARGAAEHIRELEGEVRRLEPEIASGDPAALEAYAEAQHRFEHAGGYGFDALVGRVLGGLGLGPLATRPVTTLSGGERTRLGLARLLLDDPDLLLLDEPTNHLDVAALEWLERFLVERDQTVLVASHDRWFLDRVTSRTLSFERGTVVEYRGSYSHYARQRAERDAATERAAERQSIEIGRTEDFIRRYGAGQRAKEARGRAKRLARIERIVGPERAARHGWRLEAAHLASHTVLETTPLSVGFQKLALLLRTPSLRIERGARVAVVGPNGSGKTTLVRTLLGELPALEGYVSSAPTARVAYLAQVQAELTGGTTVLDALRSAASLTEQQARDLLARFLFRGEEVLRDVGVLSGGERTRLALARLAAREANLLVLDEPTNHLDVAAREALEAVLAAYQGSMIFVSHDRYFIDRLATEIWLIDAGVLKPWKGGWSSLQRERAAGRELPVPDLTPYAHAAPKPPANPVPPKPRLRKATPAATKPSGAPRTIGRASKYASAPRRVQGLRALETRIEAMERQLRALEARVAEIARTGNYMETRRVGEEHASLERDLRALYEEWSVAADEGERASGSAGPGAGAHASEASETTSPGVGAPASEARHLRGQRPTRQEQEKPE